MVTKLTRNEIQIKMIMQRPKWQVDVMCWDRKISTEGASKAELAQRIAEADEEKFERNWKVIAGQSS